MLLRWFHAGLDGNFDAAMRYVQAWQGVRHAHVLDAFGFSEGMAFLVTLLSFHQQYQPF